MCEWVDVELIFTKRVLTGLADSNDVDPLILLCVHTMQVQNSLSDTQRLGSIDRKFRWAQVSMERDDGFVLEGCPLLADLEPSAICDQDVFSLQLDVCFIKHQRPSWAQRNTHITVFVKCECKFIYILD